MEALQGLDPDTEVRLAQQPSWAMECEVGEITTVKVGGPEMGDKVTYENDDGTECVGMVKETITDGVLVEDESGNERPVPFYQVIGYLDVKDVLYIGEGTQLAYLPGVVSRQLGWA